MTSARISRELLVALGASLVLHVGWLVREAKASAEREVIVSEVALETEAPRPVPVEPPAPVSPNAAPEPVARQSVARAPSNHSAPRQAAAQAARTLTAADNAGAADVADFTLVQGEAGTYAGGTTSSIGTSSSAVRGPARDVAAPVAPSKSVGAALGNGAPDRSRSATPLNPAWDCSRLFPSDADAGDYATVLIAVSVGSDGLPKRVAMLRDPGHGFGAAAIQCAMLQRYNAALDPQGSAISATTPPIVVRFSR